MPALNPYADGWPKLPESPAFVDLDRYSGRRDQFRTVTAKELSDPRRLYGERLHFRGEFSRMVGGREPHDFASFPGLHSGFQVSYGTGDLIGTVPQPRPFPPDPPGRGFRVDADCYGFLDYTPLVTTLGFHDLEMPWLYPRAIVPERATGPRGEADEAYVAEVLKQNVGDPLEDLGRNAYSLLAIPNRDRADLAVQGLEAALRRDAEVHPYGLKSRFFELGLLHERYTLDLDRAIACFRHAHITYHDRHGLQGASCLHHGLCLERVGRWREARQVYLDYVREYPNDFWVTDAVARLKALGAVDKVPQLELSKTERQALQNAIREFNRGHYRKGLTLLAPALRSPAPDPWPRLHALGAYLMIGDVARARDCQRDLERLQPYLAGAARSIFDFTNLADGPIEEFPISGRAITVFEDSLPLWSPAMRVLALARQQLATTPDDPIAKLLVARAAEGLELVDEKGTSPLRLDPLLRDAVATAADSPLVRMAELKLLAVSEFGPRTAIEHRDERRLAAARSLLRTSEKDVWGLHQLLLDSPLVDRRTALRHRRALERWRTQVARRRL